MYNLKASLPDSLISEGKLSDLQLEGILYAVGCSLLDDLFLMKMINFLSSGLYSVFLMRVIISLSSDLHVYNEFLVRVIISSPLIYMMSSL